MKLTPAGAAGRLNADKRAGFGADNGQDQRTGSPFGGGTSGGSFSDAGSNQSDRRSNSLGAAPRAGVGLGSGGGRLAAPVGFPGTPETTSEREPDNTPRNMFGTPPPLSRVKAENDLSYGRPSQPSGAGLLSRARTKDPEPTPAVPNIVNTSGAYSGAASRSNRENFPKWGPIDDVWLEEAIQKAEDMAREFPSQARLEFSQEAHLPFTLVISRSTPAMAVRSMVAYVEFLASICTPPRARIELQRVAALDRSFHRNVESALAPYFSGKFTVEAEPGRVEIQFSSPDPGWQDYPMLPIVS